MKPSNTTMPELEATGQNIFYRYGYKGRTPGRLMAECKNAEEAEAIIRAVNSHQMLVDDCRSSMEWFAANGYTQEAANIQKVLIKAEGRE